MGKGKIVVCIWGHGNCFSNVNGRCKCLADSKFKGKKDCPFFATREEYERKDREAKERLISMGVSELVFKYRGENA